MRGRFDGKVPAVAAGSTWEEWRPRLLHDGWPLAAGLDLNLWSVVGRTYSSESLIEFLCSLWL